MGKNEECTVTVKTATDQVIKGVMQYQHSSVQLVLKMDRNAKLRTTSGTTNIHQESSPHSYHKYREIHCNIGQQKMGVNRLNPVQKATYLKKIKSGKK